MFVVFDVETTGEMDFKQKADAETQCRMCEIAAILVDRDFEEYGSYSFIVNTPAPFQQKAIDVHGITPDVSRAIGVGVGAALAPLVSWMRIRDITLVAHNINFDWRIIRGELGRMGKEIPDVKQFCTMRESTGICRIPNKSGKSGYKFPKLDEAYRHFTGEEFSDAHTGLADARACLEVLKGIMRHRDGVDKSTEVSDDDAFA